MKKNREQQIDELTEFIKKTQNDASSITATDKKKMKKLVSDPTLLLEAFQKIDPSFTVPAFPESEDKRTSEEIIADNYIALSKFTIEKLQLKNVHKLKVCVSDCSFTIYALTPEPVELDFEQFATSDYPENKELLLEAEALQADLFMEDGTEKFIEKIVELIENVAL